MPTESLEDSVPSQTRPALTMTSYNRHQWINDSEEPGCDAPAPGYLDDLLQNIKAEVDRYIQEQPGFSPGKTRDEISAAKKDKRTAKSATQKRRFEMNIQDKEWMLANNMKSILRLSKVTDGCLEATFTYPITGPMPSEHGAVGVFQRRVVSLLGFWREIM